MSSKVDRTVIKIGFVGDPGSGKTSLVKTIIDDKFYDKVEKMNSPTILPLDSVLPNVDVALLDSDESLSNFVIEQSNVVCICYPVMKGDAFFRVSSYWIPKIRNILRDRETATPILVIGTKIDERAVDIEPQSMSVLMQKLFKENTDVERVVECSAKLKYNILSVLQIAVNVHMYPFGLLWDSGKKKFRKTSKEALRHVFNLCDRDKDLSLSFSEFSDLMEFALGEKVGDKDYEKTLVELKKLNDKNVTFAGIAFNGFLTLLVNFIVKGEYAKIWRILNQFGYDKNLNYNVKKKEEVEEKFQPEDEEQSQFVRISLNTKFGVALSCIPLFLISCMYFLGENYFMTAVISLITFFVLLYFYWRELKRDDVEQEERAKERLKKINSMNDKERRREEELDRLELWKIEKEKTKQKEKEEKEKGKEEEKEKEKEKGKEEKKND